MATQSTDVDLTLVNTDISGYIYSVIQSKVIEIDGDYTIEREQYIAPDIEADIEIAQEVLQDIESSIDIALDFEYEFPADLYVSSILDKTFYGDIDIVGTTIYDLESTFTIYEVPEAEPMLLSDDGISLTSGIVWTDSDTDSDDDTEITGTFALFFIIDTSAFGANVYYDSETKTFTLPNSANTFESNPNINGIQFCIWGSSNLNLIMDITPGTTEDGRVGYYYNNGRNTVGELSPNTFTFKNIDYTILYIGAEEVGGNVVLAIGKTEDLVKEPPTIDIESDIDIVSIKRIDIDSDLTLAKPIEQLISADISIPSGLNYDLSSILNIVPCKVADIDSDIDVDNKFASYQDIDSDIDIVNNQCIADIDSDLSISGEECYTDLSCTVYIFNTKYQELDGNVIIEKARIQSYTFIC